MSEFKNKNFLFEEAVLLSLLKDEEAAKKKLEEKTAVLEHSLKRLENFRIAILNILEDSSIVKEDLEREKARFQAMLSSIEEGLVLASEKGAILYSNSIAQDLLEENEDSLYGKDFSEIIKCGVEKKITGAKKEDIEYLDPVSNVLKKQKTFSSKISDNLFFVTKSGKKFFAVLTISPIMVGNKLSGIIIAFRDVSIEREADRMKTEFISIASHQLKTPMSAMKWFLEMLLSGDAGKLNDEQEDFVKEIYRSNERVIELVNALLNVSRIESGRLTIDPKPTNLAELASEAAKNIEIFANKKSQQFVFEAQSENIPLVKVDSQIIYQVMTNLLSNAVKYTPEKGTIKFTVSLQDNDVVFKVQDNGYGIPKDQQPRIFQKFFRGDNVVAISREGTGLGLYTAKSLVENSGGKIGFNSEENKGSVFWFTIPLSGTEPKKGERRLENTVL